MRATNGFRAALVLFLFCLTANPLSAMEFKSPDQVFRLEAQWDASENLQLYWSISPGFYLYRNRIAATVGGKKVEIQSERGELKDDPTFGLTEIYRSSAAGSIDGHLLPQSGHVTVTYQGCGENTICYPPVSKSIDLASLTISDVQPPDDVTAEAAVSAPAAARDLKISSADAGDANAAKLSSTSSKAGGNPESDVLKASLISIILSFLGFGLLLSFTPCVFPMIPILSGMLAQSGEKLSMARGFALSVSYVTAMALAYSILGIFAAWFGGNLQATLQTPVAITAMSVVFLLLALSMFGLYELQLPQSWTAGLAAKTGGRGSVLGAAVLGFGSALIVSPCVTPPLAAALVFVAQTGKLLQGSAALFALGLGMGLPLLAFGTLGTRVLPRSGAWLIRTKHAFGFIFVGLAIWMISRELPVPYVAVAWGLLFVAIGGYLAKPFLHDRWEPASFIAASLGSLVFIYGGSLLVGVSLSAYEPLRPLSYAGLIASPAEARADIGHIRTVVNENELNKVVELGRKQGRAIMIDFSADWCTECRLMERNVLSQGAVRQQLRNVLLVRADLTHFDRSSQTLMQRFSVIGPPTIIFLRPDGSEITDARVVGETDVSGFLSKAAKADRT